MNKRILVDMDGVIADFEQGFLDAWRQKYPEKPYISLDKRQSFYIRDDYPNELKAEVESIYSAPGFIIGLAPIAGAVEALREMKAAGHTVRICTSPLSQYKNCVEEKYSWVENHLGADWISSIIFAKDKTEIRGDYLIDDRPEVKGEMIPEWEYILFNQPYNILVSNKKRLNIWSEWRKVIFS